MSIKKLFESTNDSRNYLSEESQKDAFQNVESAKNAAEIKKNQERFIPQVDYSQPTRFAKYGSAQLYYKAGIDRIIDYFPYDGSDYEVNEFTNNSLYIEKYIFDDLYPRTNGYALLSADGWGTRDSAEDGYGLPDDLEYIEFTGGPHTITSSTSAGLFPDPESAKRNSANIYDTDIYTTAGLPSTYGTGSRESNLECNFDKGVTLEFWLKKKAFDTALTSKEVICDIWNGGTQGASDYGRVLLSIRDSGTSTDAPFILTVYDGTTGFTEKVLGSSNITSGSLANDLWQHYAVTMQNSGSDFITKLYVSGALNDRDTTAGTNLGTLAAKTGGGALSARIGATITSPQGLSIGPGAGKLSASMDEFRFWKAARNAQEIGEHWFTQVRGGTNTDISNTTLGVYYKFNEGITGTASIDNSVLDYSGRISNGGWIGYDSYSRSTDSAIVEAGAAATEFKDPIIRSNNPNVVSVRDSLLKKGANYDFNNNAAFKTLIPSWVLEEQEDSKGNELTPTYENNIEMVSHIIGAYFDQLRLQIKALPSFRHLNYTSGAYTPLPFAEHLPQSLGLYTPQLFVDSTVLEQFMNRNPTMLFEGDLNETKNLIYLNLYNNLTNIYKSKGTEKAIRNVFRCFHLDDKLVRLNVYSNNETYELKDNLRQTLINKKALNFNALNNPGAVVYQAKPVAPGNYLLTENWWSRQAYTSKSSLQLWARLNTDITSTEPVDSSTHERTLVRAGSAAPGYSTTLYPSKFIQTASDTFNSLAVTAINIGAATVWDPIIGNDTVAGSTELMTFSAWIYKTADGGGSLGRILDFGNTDISWYTTSTEEVQFSAKWNGSSVFWTTPASMFSLNTWTHVAVTYNATDNANDPKIYVNGVAQTVTVDSGAKTGAFDGIIGNSYIAERGAGDRGFDGQISDVGIWNSILNPSEVKALYNAKGGVGATSDVAESVGYISGSAGAGIIVNSKVLGYEFPYGFTAEADFILPKFANETSPYLNRSATDISLFGICSASTDDGGERPLNDTTWYTNDNASMQVYAVRDPQDEKTVYFKLTSSLLGPGSTDDTIGPFPTLTSSYFYEAYDDSNWNLSVRLKPTDFGITNMVSGAMNNDYKYDVIFSGFNHELGTIQNSFTVTGTMTQTKGHNFLKAAKRLSLGAHRTNVTGTLIAPNDTICNSAKYWLKYLDDISLRQHAYDIDNAGVSGSWRSISPLDPNLSVPEDSQAWINGDGASSGSILNANMLALDWKFDNLTSSNVNGEFLVTDYSSGSLSLRENYGWVGATAGYQHGGTGYGWPANSQAIIATQSVNAYQFINPEYAASSDMINIMTDDDKYFGIFQTPPNYRYVLEKSMYNAISEEMLDFFAGAIDFHNVIGDPVNRYRGRYKTLEKLREIFFKRVSTSSRRPSGSGVTEVERFIDYYKWFDDAIAIIIGQLLPASTDFTPDIYNTIESHVLERNKYKSKYPIIKDETTDPEGSAWGSYSYNPSPPASSPRPTNVSPNFWQFQADRNSAEITSNNTDVDRERNTIRDVVGSDPTYPAALPYFTDTKGNIYQRGGQATRRSAFVKAKGNLRSGSVIRGGVNFLEPKSLAFTYNALYPAGPVNLDNEVFVPKNVLLADVTDLVPMDEITANTDNFPPDRKLKRFFARVQHGRNWQDGYGYSNTKSSFSFPFSIMSSSVTTGYNKQVVDRVGAGLEVVNLHQDAYGKDLEVPMQSPFTDHTVGGHQSRHVPLNKGPDLDTYLTRPEAWKLLLGKCPNTSGAIGMAGADYPWPEANDEGEVPYPMTASQKAVYYRGYTAKRPVNIRNISQSLASPLGNYRHNYEIVSTVGAYANPRQFAKTQPTLPAQITQTPSASQGRSYLGIHREENSHFEFIPDYSLAYFRSAGTKATADFTVTDYPTGGQTFTLKDTAGTSVTFEADGSTTTADGSKNAAGNVIIGTFGGGFTLADLAGRITSAINGANNTYGYIAITSRQDGSTVNFSLAQDGDGYDGNTSIDMSGWTGLESTAFAAGTDTAATGKSVIISRFAAPGDIQSMGLGYMDIRSGELSVYNALPYRNWSVIRPFQASSSISQATGSGTPGIRMSDQTGRDYGLRILLARHSARFGRDSRFETAEPGATYDQLPSFQKTNRNRLVVIKSSSSGYSSGSQFDNAYVTHAIPRSDKQYSWLTASLVPSTNMRYYRYAPTSMGSPDWLLGYYSGSTGYVSYYDFVSGSNIETTTGIYQPTSRLNVLIQEPITASASNIIGFPSGSDVTNYFNSAFIDKLPAADSALITGSTANYFNLLMNRRGNTFGWTSWRKVNQSDNPIYQKEVSSSTISLTKVIPKPELTSYRLTPVSTKGRPVLLNITAPTSSEGDSKQYTANVFTLKATNNNEKIFTSNTSLDNFLELSIADVTTPYDHILSVVQNDSKYTLNWLLYSEGVYPSDYNEFYETTFTRTGYDNKFWNDRRTGTPSRASIGGTFSNSFDIAASQSCWTLDAQEDFLTRTKFTLPSPSWNSSSATDDGLIYSGAAGELQNNYFFYYDTLYSTGGPLENANEALAPGALYARKHMLTTPQAVSPWNNIAEVGQARWLKGEFNSSSMTLTPEPYAGEALWEADTQAGRIVKSNGVASFEVTASKPWFNDYDDFKYEIKLVAQNYSIIPEFRISDHIEDYINYGILNPSLTNTFTIPGTALSSSESNFYKDYSNSEFMKEFINIPSETNLSASEIRLVMSAAIRFNPYKGFYPAQRTIDIVNQFSKSFGAGIVGKTEGGSLVSGDELFYTSGSLVRPLAQPLFAPGILYNSIKAGMAVDYPVIVAPTKLTRYPWTGSSEVTDNWALTFRNGSTVSSDLAGYGGGAWFDQRLPFETIIEPDKYINGFTFIDCEPHPSCSLTATASWSGDVDEIYTKMISNFFGEIPKFFLKGGASTTLTSGIITDGLIFEKNDVYAARIKLLRSTNEPRNYNFEKGSTGDGAGWGKLGFIGWSGSAGGSGRLAGGFVPVPQDPVKNPSFKPLFQPYSRPTAFGPPVAGRPDWDNTGTHATRYARQGGEYGVRDSFAGSNPAFTPPYTDGQAWFDLVFTPIAGETYDLERIMTETSGVCWRFDRGPERYTDTMKKYQNIPACQTGSDDPGPPYGGENINANSMQLSASFNLFGIETVTKQTTDKFGNLIEDKNETAGKRWVIQSKFETPLLNFTDADPVHPITDANGTLTLPDYGDKAVPRGIWHQFGVQPSTADMGVFISIEDVDTNWLKYHYNVITDNSVYNRNDAVQYGENMYSEVKSLSTLLGFDQTTSKKRMGQIAQKQTIKEAVVAVPYITERILDSELAAAAGTLAASRKKFVEIPKDRFDAALDAKKGTEVGDSLETAGGSIRRLLQKMDRYVLPPQFDFINNTDIKPVVMYMFEFEYELDKDDLAYIWQNIAPRDYQKLKLESADVAHELIDNELLSGDVLQNEDLRWMVFKVKQRGMTKYFDDILKQSGESSDIFDDVASSEKEYRLDFNWPYDFISIVEMAKMDVQVLYKADTGTTSYDDNHAHTYTMNNQGNGETSYNDGHYHEIIDGLIQESDGHTHSLENKE